MLRIFLALTLWVGISAPAFAAKYFPYQYPATVCPIVQADMPGPNTANCTEPTDSWWEVRMADDSSLPVLAAADHQISAASAFGTWFMANPTYSARCPYAGLFSECALIEQWNVANLESSNGGCNWMSPYTVITGAGSTNHNDNAPYGKSLSRTTYEIVMGRRVDLDFEPWPGHPYCANNNNVQKMEVFPLDESPNGKAFIRLSAKCAVGEYLQAHPYDWDPTQTGEVIFWCNDTPAQSAPIPLESTSGLDSDRQGCSYGCNPVDLVSGAKLDYVLDYANHSPYPIVWSRRYDSRQGVWTFNYDRRLTTPAGSGRPMEAVIDRPDGSKLRFTRASSSSAWDPDDLNALGTLTSQAVTGGEAFEYTNLLDEAEIYNISGQLIELRNAIGQKITLEYHASGDLERIEDDFGRHLDVRMTTATAGTNPISVTDGDKTVEYVFTSSAGKNLLTQVIYPDGEDVDYLYDEGLPAGGGLMTGIIAEDELRWGTYTYNIGTKAVESTAHGAGLDLTLYEIIPGGVAMVDWGSGYSYFDLYDPQVAATKKTKGSNAPCPNCGGASVESINYNSQGVPTSYTNFDQVSVSKTVDGRGLTLTETVAPGSALERTTTYTWKPDLRLPSTITEQVDVAGVPETRLTSFTYDSNNRLTQASIDPSSAGATRTWTWTHNADGQILTATSPTTGTTTRTYDSQGNLASSQNSLLQTTFYGDYTTQGLVGTITDPNGLQLKMTYDDRERVVEVKRGTPGTHWESMTIEYELYGQVKKITHPDGTGVEYSYDSAHRLVEITDQRGRMVLTLSNDGDVIRQEVFSGPSTLVQEQDYTYDNLRRLQKVIDAQNKETIHQYRANGSVLQSINDPDGTSFWQWYQHFDDMGRPSILAYPSATREVTYDRNGQLVAAHDGNFVYTYYTYNGFGEAVQTVSPDNGTSNVTYDAYGRPSVATDARGVTSTTTYDGAGRPTQVVHDGSSATPMTANETQTFTYDTCSNGVGRLCEVSDHSGTTTFAYDLWGRVTTKTAAPAVGSFTLVTSYAYNNAGQLISTTYPSGKRVDLAYDRGLPTSIEYDFQPVLSDITYRPFGTAVTGWDWDSFAGQVRFDYDLNGRLSSIEDTDERDYVRNAKGWVLGITDPINGAADQAYNYNSMGNLTQADLAARPDPIDYRVGENDDIIRKTLGPSWSDEVFYDLYTNYGINNRLPSIQVGFNPTTYLTHDASGNMLDDGDGLTMVYDAKGRPRSTSRLGTNATYAFNAMGQRVRKSGSHLSTGHRFYAYDEAGRVLGEYDANGDALEEYVYLDGFRPVALVRNIGLSSIADIYPVLTDHLGTPRKVLDDTGAPQWSWDAKDPYGHQMPDQLAGGSTFVFNLRFPGQRYDSETGLYHNGFRDYNPATGRYVQADPIGLAGGWNPYAYVGANPINASDPTGLVVDYGNLSMADQKSMKGLIGAMRNQSQYFDNVYRTVDASPQTYALLVKRKMGEKEEPGNWEMNDRSGNPMPTVTGLQFNPNYHVTSCEGELPFAMQVAHEFGHAYLDELVKQGLYSYGFDPFNWDAEGQATMIEGIIGKELGLPARGKSGVFNQAWRDYYWRSKVEYRSK